MHTGGSILIFTNFLSKSCFGFGESGVYMPNRMRPCIALRVTIVVNKNTETCVLYLLYTRKSNVRVILGHPVDSRLAHT